MANSGLEVRVLPGSPLIFKHLAGNSVEGRKATVAETVAGARCFQGLGDSQMRLVELCAAPVYAPPTHGSMDSDYRLQRRDVHFASAGRQCGSGTLTLGTYTPPSERLVGWGEDRIKVFGCCPRPARKTLANKGNPECLDLESAQR